MNIKLCISIKQSILPTIVKLFYKTTGLMLNIICILLGLKAEVTSKFIDILLNTEINIT
jgi:hypothetical protein